MEVKDTNYLFIRIPKTASTSICHILRPVEHKTTLEWKKELGAEFDNKLVFSVVRNPYDRFISMYYFFACFGKAHREGGIIKKQDINEWLIEHNINEVKSHPDYKFIKPQVDFLADENGHLLTTNLLKFENLNKDWKKLLKELNIKYQKLPIKRKGYARPDEVVLTQESKDKIYNYYKNDFELLGYSK